MRIARELLLFVAAAKAFQPRFTQQPPISSLGLPRASDFYRQSSVVPLRIPLLRATIEREETTSSGSVQQQLHHHASPPPEPSKRILGEPIHYSDLTIGVLAEDFDGENRVSQTPDSVLTLTKAGFRVLVAQGGE
jgi:hypothetical protein